MKRNKAQIIGTILLGGILLSSFYGVGKTMASERGEYGEHEYEHEREYGGHDNRYQPRMLSRNSTAYPQYIEECGSCHMAYPPQLLPPPSWVSIMNNLDDHFGENAEVDDQTRMQLQGYLAEVSGTMNYRKLFRNLGNRLPTRITKLPYFIRKHDEIPARYVEGNVKVGSFSQCNACHRGAERGNFDEDNVSIPGVGRWD
jgi:hypothetical protein